VNEINKFIAGLNDNQKKLLVIAVVIVISALFDRLLIGPTMSRLSSIEDDISKEEVTIKQDIRFLGHKDRILQESDEVAPFLTKDMATDEEMTAAFLKKLESLADLTKVNLIKINPSSGEQDADYFKYQADLECSGSLENVISFMHAINSDTDLMKVDKYNFSAKKSSDTDEVKATMTVEKIVVTEKPMPAKAKDANVPSTPPAASS